MLTVKKNRKNKCSTILFFVLDKLDIIFSVIEVNKYIAKRLVYQFHFIKILHIWVQD